MNDDSRGTASAARGELTPERVDRNQRVYADVVDKYYGDPDFRARMDADPTAVLKAEGLEIPGGAEVKLLFNTENLLHIVLPAPDPDGG